MVYYNNIHAFGPERFCHEAAQAGIDGLIIPDMPPEEASLLKGPAAAAGLQLIFLLAPRAQRRDGPLWRASRRASSITFADRITGAKLLAWPM